MAIPDKATILASTPNLRILIKVISTPIGSKLEIKTDARRLKTSINTTKILINISNVKASCKVPKVSLIKLVLS